jgi:hypothetical protein
MRRIKKIKVFRKRAQPNQRVTIESISLACERFFLSRGMPNREAFTGWGRPSPKQEEDELA